MLVVLEQSELPSDGESMKEIKHAPLYICVCATLEIPVKLTKKITSKVKRLFSSKDEARPQVDMSVEARKFGFYSFEETHSKDGTEVHLNVRIMPSKLEFYSLFDEISEDQKKRSPKKKKKKSEIKDQAKELADMLDEKRTKIFFALRREGELPRNTLDLKDLRARNLPEKIINFLTIMKTLSLQLAPAQSCMRFSYDLRKFKLVGGFMLPTRIPISNKITERLGEVDVTGFHLSFKDSPLNFNRIEIRQVGNNIEIFSEFSARMRVSPNLFQEAFDYGVQASNLFVEAK